MKGLINLKNKDDECFKWCHVRFINPINSHPEKINKKDKEIAKTLGYRSIKFPIKVKDYEIIEERFNINVNVFGEEKSHYVLIKDFNKLMYSRLKTKNAHKKHFCMACLQNFTTKEILNNHRERCLLINDTQAVKYETGVIKFKNYEKQIPIPFKIYADTECLVKRTNISLGKHTKLYQEHIPNSIGAKLVCIDDRFTLPTKFLQVIIALKILLNGFLHSKKELIK